MHPDSDEMLAAPPSASELLQVGSGFSLGDSVESLPPGNNTTAASNHSPVRRRSTRARGSQGTELTPKDPKSHADVLVLPQEISPTAPTIILTPYTSTNSLVPTHNDTTILSYSNSAPLYKVNYKEERIVPEAVAADSAEPEPEAAAAEVAEPEPAAVAAEVAEPEPAAVAAEVAEPEPAAVAAEAAEPEPAAVAAEAAEPEPAAVAAEVAEPEPEAVAAEAATAGSEANAADFEGGLSQITEAELLRVAAVEAAPGTAAAAFVPEAQVDEAAKSAGCISPSSIAPDSTPAELTDEMLLRAIGVLRSQSRASVDRLVQFNNRIREQATVYAGNRLESSRDAAQREFTVTLYVSSIISRALASRAVALSHTVRQTDEQEISSPSKDKKSDYVPIFDWDSAWRVVCVGFHSTPNSILRPSNNSWSPARRPRYDATESDGFTTPSAAKKLGTEEGLFLEHHLEDISAAFVSATDAVTTAYRSACCRKGADRNFLDGGSPSPQHRMGNMHQVLRPANSPWRQAKIHSLSPKAAVPMDACDVSSPAEGDLIDRAFALFRSPGKEDKVEKVEELSGNTGVKDNVTEVLQGNCCVAVIGATGHLGLQIVASLLSSGSAPDGRPVQVRALVRCLKDGGHDSGKTPWGRMEALRTLQSSFKDRLRIWTGCELLREGSCEDALLGCEWVVYAAAGKDSCGGGYSEEKLHASASKSKVMLKNLLNSLAKPRIAASVEKGGFILCCSVSPILAARAEMSAEDCGGMGSVPQLDETLAWPSSCGTAGIASADVELEQEMWAWRKRVGKVKKTSEGKKARRPVNIKVCSVLMGLLLGPLLPVTAVPEGWYTDPRARHLLRIPTKLLEDPEEVIGLPLGMRILRDIGSAGLLPAFPAGARVPVVDVRDAANLVVDLISQRAGGLSRVDIVTAVEAIHAGGSAVLTGDVPKPPVARVVSVAAVSALVSIASALEALLRIRLALPSVPLLKRSKANSAAAVFQSAWNPGGAAALPYELPSAVGSAYGFTPRSVSDTVKEAAEALLSTKLLSK